MNIVVVDDRVVFASHLVSFDYSLIPLEDHGAIDSFHKNTDGILCFNEEELNKVEAMLTKLEISFETESLTFPQSQKDRVIDKKYNSRTEAIQHLNNEIEMPEQEIIPFLRRERNVLKEQLDTAEKDKEALKERLDAVETEKDVLKGRVDAMQDEKAMLAERMNILESSMKVIERNIVPDKRT